LGKGSGRRIVHSLRCSIFFLRKTSKVSLSIPAFCRQRRGEERRREERGGRDKIFLGRLLGGRVKSQKKVLLGSFEREK